MQPVPHPQEESEATLEDTEKRFAMFGGGFLLWGRMTEMLYLH